MKISDEERNRIRCSVALAVPLVINYITGNHSPEEFEKVRHMMPTYVLEGVRRDVSPYFTPWDTGDQGKKRVYVNSNGYRIRYITHKMLKHYRDDIIEYMGGTAEDTALKYEIDQIAGRWVIMEGDLSSKKKWISLKNSIVAVEKFNREENHPPVGDEWQPLMIDAPTYEGGNISLKKYTWVTEQ